jgi:hypothetical protein
VFAGIIVLGGVWAGAVGPPFPSFPLDRHIIFMRALHRCFDEILAPADNQYPLLSEIIIPGKNRMGAKVAPHLFQHLQTRPPWAVNRSLSHSGMGFGKSRGKKKQEIEPPRRQDTKVGKYAEKIFD